MQQETQCHRARIPQQALEDLKAEPSCHTRDQHKDGVRSQYHDPADELHRDVVYALEEPEDGLAPILADRGGRDAEEDAEQDQGEHLGVGGSADRVPRYHIQQQFYDPWGLLRQIDSAGGLAAIFGEQPFPRCLAQTATGLDYIREDQTDAHRYRCGDEVVGYRFSTDPADRPQIAQARGSDDQTGHDEGDDDHCDEPDPADAEVLDGGHDIGAKLPGREIHPDTDHHTGHESNGDLGIQFHAVSLR